MEINGRRILLCDCEHTMALDGKALAKACGADGTPEIASQLCRYNPPIFTAKCCTLSGCGAKWKATKGGQTVASVQQ